MGRRQQAARWVTILVLLAMLTLQRQHALSMALLARKHCRRSRDDPLQRPREARGGVRAGRVRKHSEHGARHPGARDVQPAPLQALRGGLLFLHRGAALTRALGPQLNRASMLLRGGPQVSGAGCGTRHLAGEQGMRELHRPSM